MKSVQIEFHNIQSHEHTRFSLEPGLNFILADDNNVGKSTIFKAMCTMIKGASASNEDLCELLRSNTNEGYASFRYDEIQVVFWITRDDGRARSFFEVRGEDGTISRSASCPVGLLKALDIVIGEDGLPINFNDADSVQLIVQDTPRNDAVFLKILVDDRIENVRYNAYQLDRQISNDYNVASNRRTDAQRVLQNLTFTPAVEDFNAELEMLLAATRVTDYLMPQCVFSSEEACSVDTGELEVLQRVADLLTQTASLSFDGERVTEELVEDIEFLQCASYVLSVLSTIDAAALEDTCKAEVPVDTIERAISVLGTLNKAFIASSIAESQSARLLAYDQEAASLRAKLSSECPVVLCPVKGEVYYTHEKCIPSGS